MRSDHTFTWENSVYQVLTKTIVNNLVLEGGPFEAFLKEFKMVHTRNNSRDDVEASNANQDQRGENSPPLAANH